ncbi:hypothetical protein MKX03_003807 [Papaver bracteatum]|nr:hypothetical protein MKX03_003807 [Papaver bracteatum]
MPSYCSLLVYKALFLLVSIVFVYASIDHESVVPSALPSCSFPCLAYCRCGCDALGTYWYRQRCLTPPEDTTVICDCCYQCTPGDTYTETTIPISNCADCTNWCCVTDDKCAISESKFVRHCKCCCRGGNSDPKFS